MHRAAFIMLALAVGPDGYQRVKEFDVQKLIGLESPARVWVEAAGEDFLETHNPLKPCRLCVQPIGGLSSQTVCFSALADSTYGVREFFLDPHAEAIDISTDSSGRKAIFFTAWQNLGGSGSLNLLTLLVFSQGQKTLDSLLPPILLAEQSEYRFWIDREASPYKLLTVADFVWGHGEAHFAEHHYRISTYAWSPAIGMYARIDEYVTAKKYEGLDSRDVLNVIEGEDATLRARLKKVASQPR
jgi:hypothetical protein